MSAIIRDEHLIASQTGEDVILKPKNLHKEKV